MSCLSRDSESLGSSQESEPAEVCQLGVCLGLQVTVKGTMGRIRMHDGTFQIPTQQDT